MLDGINPLITQITMRAGYPRDSAGGREPRAENKSLRNLWNLWFPWESGWRLKARLPW